MLGFLYYLAYAGSAASVAYGLLYVYDKQMATELMQQISWNTVRTYHKVNLKFQNVKNWYNNSEKEKKEDIKEEEEEESLVNNNINENTQTFIGYKNSDDTTYTSNEVEENEYIAENDFDLMLIKDKKESTYFKRIEDKNNLYKNMEVNVIEKPFLQVEISERDIEGGDKRTSIHKNLECFYVEGNKLFDEVFLKWYLINYFGMILPDNYTIHIIDKDINMFNLSKNEYIKLKDKNEKVKPYTVIAL